MVRRKKPTVDIPTEKYIERELSEIACDMYSKYGVAVLEDRAIPDFRDGLNPVNRRALWSAYRLAMWHNTKPVKSARLVGDIIGKYHPHGDSSAYQAVVGMTNGNSAFPLFKGEGNWGSLTSPRAAAARYTEIRLSEFAQKVVLNKFYMPVLDLCPNYDSTDKEPLVLPALLPIALLNGRFGIAPGATTNIPVCTYSSLLQVLEYAYSGNKLTPRYVFDTLRFTSTYGGVERPVKSELNQRKTLFVSKKGRTTLVPRVAVTASGCYVTQFASDQPMARSIAKLLTVDGVMDATDASDTADKYGKIEVTFKREFRKAPANTSVLRAVSLALSNKENYVLNFTERYLDNTGQGSARVLPKSLLQFFEDWVQWRVDLEIKACKYWAAKAQEELDHLNLMVLAVDNRAVILKSLEKACSQEELEAWLAKQLGITVKQAAVIYQLRVVQLRKLEKQTLLTKIKEVTLRKTTLVKRGRSPLPFLKEQLKELQ